METSFTCNSVNVGCKINELQRDKERVTGPAVGMSMYGLQGEIVTISFDVLPCGNIVSIEMELLEYFGGKHKYGRQIYYERIEICISQFLSIQSFKFPN